MAGEGLRSMAVMERVMKMTPQTIPKNTELLLAGVDVGQNHVYVVVRAFLADKRSVAVYAAKIEGENLADALSQLVAGVLRREWVIEGCNESMRISKAAVDCGYSPNEIYSLASLHPQIIQAVRGYAIDSIAKLQRKDTAVETYTDRRSLPGLKFLIKNVPTGWYRQQILLAYKKSLADPGAFLIGPGLPRMYGDHLESWQIHQYKMRSGQTAQKWIGSREDHFLDCECYIFALKDITGSQAARRIVERQSALPTTLKARNSTPFIAPSINRGDSSMG